MSKHTWQLHSREGALAFVLLCLKPACAVKAEPCVQPTGKAFPFHRLLFSTAELPNPHHVPSTRCSHFQAQNSSACAGMLLQYSKQPYLFYLSLFLYQSCSGFPCQGAQAPPKPNSSLKSLLLGAARPWLLWIHFLILYCFSHIIS